MEKIIEYAPIIIVVAVFLLKHKIFVTPMQLSETHKKIADEMRNEYLTIIAHTEFEKRINDNFKAIEQRLNDSSKRFDKIDMSLDHIKDILINRNN